ncbi:MAG: hypothetical protein ACE141_01895 [Bryobacteraceae bacterium]
MKRLTILLLGALAASAASEGCPAAPGHGVEQCTFPAARSVGETSVALGKVYRPLTGKERLDYYTKRTFLSPGAFFRIAGPSLGSHLANRPAEWGQGTEGYGRRFADRYGRFVLRRTYEAAGAAALGHEVRYIPSTRTGFLPRAGHALAATFVTHDRSGRRTPHLARLGSAFAAEFTGNLWMPAGYRTGAEAVRGVGIELGVGSAFNLLREFSPELKRILPGN